MSFKRDEDEQVVIRALIRALVNPRGTREVRNLSERGQIFLGKVIFRIMDDGIARGRDITEVERYAAMEAYEIVGVDCPHHWLWNGKYCAYECSLCLSLRVRNREEAVTKGEQYE